MKDAVGDMDERFTKLARRMLVQDEGVRYEPYLDTKGFWTIGVGHYIGSDLKKLHLSYDLALAMLDEDMEKHADDLLSIFGAQFHDFALARQVALLDVKFTLSKRAFIDFEKMIAAIKRNDWDTAAKELLNSKWSHDVDPKQIPNEGRDNRLAFMLKTARLHPDYEIEE